MLINSAGYNFGVLPLDGSVSLIGPNNSGKTSFINALQFLFIRNINQMEFDSHEKSETKKFYFPSTSSYILLEMQLKNNLVVIGCVGKGISHDYEYFSYAGSLKKDDFITEEGNIVEESKLLTHLSNRGISVNVYRRPSDFFDALYGRSDISKNGIDIRLFSVKSNLSETFQEVLVKTLNLKKLDAQDIKRFLLKINGSTYSGEYDFSKVWHESFQDVEADKKQFKACKRLEKGIDVLERTVNEVHRLRGKIGVMKPLIDKALDQWDALKNKTMREYEFSKKASDREIESLQNEHDSITKRNNEIERELSSIKQENEDMNRLANLFAHVTTRGQLVSILEEKDNALSMKKVTLQNAKNGNLNKVKRDIEDAQNKIERLQLELKHGKNLFKVQIKNFLSTEEQEILFGLIHQQILTFNVDELGNIKQFADSFKNFLNKQGEEMIEINGLTIRKDKIRKKISIRDPEELENEIRLSKDDLTKLFALQKALENRDHCIKEIQELQKEYNKAENNLNQFDKLQDLQKNKAERERHQKELYDELEENKRKDSKNKEAQESFRKQIAEVSNKIHKLSDDDREIEGKKQQRIDDEPYFKDLLEMSHIPYLEEDILSDENIPFNLNTTLTNQKTDCLNLKEADRKTTSLLEEFLEAGFTKYQGQGSKDEQIEAIINYKNNLANEEIGIQNGMKTAIAKVSSGLKRLEHQYNSFHEELDAFNSIVQKRKVSDLEKMAVESTEMPALDAIKTFSKYSHDTEDSFDLFSLEIKSDSAGNAELDKARDVLLKVCNNEGQLKLENLFELAFIVSKKNASPQEFKDLDKIGSNGSILMAKLLYGLALLNRMSNDNERVMSVCYLDEAASLDATNQKNLINSAKEFGFNLLFASPEPQNSARYCIAIERRGSANFITEKQWQILEEIEDEERPAI